MALTTTKLNQILERQQECERQTKLLQQQVQAFENHFNIPPSQNNAVVDSPSSSTNVPDGKYVIFISTRKTQIPMDVIAAFVMAKESLISSGKIKDIPLTLINKENESVPRILTPAPNQTEIFGNSNVSRLLYRIANQDSQNIIETTQIDVWMNKSTQLNTMNKEEFNTFINNLNEYLRLRSTLVGYGITSCDLSLYCALKQNQQWKQVSNTISPPNNGPINVMRWFIMMDKSSLIHEANKYVESQNERAQKSRQKQQKKGKQNERNTKQKASASASWDIGIDEKYNGNIVTRFPPEPSGFLHIGHAKAVFINWKISRQFAGKMIVRLDDTNPAKEKAEFEENILRDLQCLGVRPDFFSHTSDYFGYYVQCCTRVIKNGNAYCDQTAPKEMKEQRSERIENKYRTQSIDENLRLWKEMCKGSEEGQLTCVRMKLDMKSDNGTLRDPTIYRCNVSDAHHLTGRKFNVYPTYDFACPIVDSIEGVTHAFRSKEYNERNEQYKLMWDIICKGEKNPLDDNGIISKGSDLVLPNMFQFSRLDFVRTVLSKRKLSKLIERGVVTGWNDPRLPTVQGIFRRGLQLEALDKFVLDQAMSVVNTEQEWDKIWSYNQDILDPKIGRYFAVSDDERVVINITNMNNDTCCSKSVSLAPEKYKQLSGQIKLLELSNKVYIERFEIMQAIERNKKKNETHLILMNWGIINMDKIHYDESNSNIVCIDATFEKDNKNYKGKCAVNWVADNGLNNLIPIKLVELDYLFNNVQKPKNDDEKTMEWVLEENKNQTWFETNCLAESAVRLLSKGDIIQFIKLGNFIVDKPYLGRISEPAILIYIPDGKEKSMSKIWQYLRKVKSGAGGKPNVKNQANSKGKNKGKNKKNNKQSS